MSMKKNIEVREITDKERKMLKNGDMPGKAIDMTVDKALPPEVMDFVVKEVVAPIINAIVVVGMKMYGKGMTDAIRAVDAKAIAASILKDCRKEHQEDGKCEKCNHRKECDELTKAAENRAASGTERTGKTQAAESATTSTATQSPSVAKKPSVAGNQAKAAKKPTKAKGKAK